MSYEVRASSKMGAIAASRDTAVEAYALARQYEADNLGDVVVKTPDGTEYGVSEFYQAPSSGGPV